VVPCLFWQLFETSESWAHQGCAPAAAGYNVCIFAYGQTGSGKTHTMAGSNVENMADRGINYRALDDLFAINAQRAGEVNPLSPLCDVLLNL
jgi:Kinesin motor domain